MVGGEDSSSTPMSDLEIVVLENSSFPTNCALLYSYPFPVSRAIGASLYHPSQDEWLPVVCGGRTHVGVEKICTALFPWGWSYLAEMHQPRMDHAGSVFDDGTFLVTGGSDGSGSLLDSVEVWTAGLGAFTSAPGVLPIPTSSHCQVTVDANKVGYEIQYIQEVHRAY